jgi:hypothetical protein
LEVVALELLIGGGRKPKLAQDNAGLIAGAAALNGLASPKMATDICNAVNAQQNLKICTNTFMRTLKMYGFRVGRYFTSENWKQRSRE